ncbi:H/ACA ribonucleoprotein complex subunit GAR1 [Haladaptatus sp. DYF46]|uniref:H/ACA ribonucleoprotein complex subunit GAR1 n=1 Tax=unclassified Haladaptatus TaxID=2622732 RepID=UPI001E528FEC|nr:Gar1/Naf1 family protein [Haladaptatus sp. DYF46]
MQRLGQVVRTAQGLAIVRSPSEEYPNIGTNVVDEGLSTVGRVVDVFGPVSRPYVAVSPDEETQLATLVGSKLYAR